MHSEKEYDGAVIAGSENWRSNAYPLSSEIEIRPAGR